MLQKMVQLDQPPISFSFLNQVRVVWVLPFKFQLGNLTLRVLKEKEMWDLWHGENRRRRIEKKGGGFFSFRDFSAFVWNFWFILMEGEWTEGPEAGHSFWFIWHLSFFYDHYILRILSNEGSCKQNHAQQIWVLLGTNNGLWARMHAWKERSVMQFLSA